MSSSPELTENERIRHEKIMSQGEGFKVKLIGSEGKEQIGEIRIQSYTPGTRLLKSLEWLGLFWGMALLSVFIPVAHFFLVPGLLIAGLVVGYITYGTESIVLGGEGLCPNCGAFFPVARVKEKWPLNDLCTHCRTQITIEKFLN